MTKLSIILVLIAVVFIGIGAILPALANVRDHGAMPRAFVGSYTLGVFLVSGVVVGSSVCVVTRKVR
jgi:hypothetical protein